MGHSRLDDRDRLFKRAMVTAETDKFRIVRFGVLLHGFLVYVLFAVIHARLSVYHTRMLCQKLWMIAYSIHHLILPSGRAGADGMRVAF